MTTDYHEFLKSKHQQADYGGFDVTESQIHPQLYKFQNAVTRWALKLGKAALFEECGLGKGQPYGSQILTPKGGVSIECLQIGDTVIASDGKAYPVTGIYPKGEIDTYRFIFNDGASFVVDKDHLHWVRPYNDRTKGKPFRVMNTLDIIDSGIRYGKGEKSRKYDIPVVDPIEFSAKDLLIDPYLLGVLLGDGGLSIDNRVILTSSKHEIISKVVDILDSYDMHLTQKSDRISYDLCGNKPKHNNHVLNALRKYGLTGKKAQGKFIPVDYLFSSVEDRLALLRGLMDTDGYIKETTQHYTTSKQLHEDVKFLIRSLGGIPKSSVKQGKYCDSNGQIVECSDCYTLTFSLKTFNPFTISYKADLWNPNPRANGRWIDKIEYVGKQKTICISVDSPDHSYVTEDLIVTHNTLQQLEWAKHVAQHTQKHVLILAPLAVAPQTVQEAKKLGMSVTYCESKADVKKLPLSTIPITNYDRLHKFDTDLFGGVVLDESSILKNFTGATKNALLDAFKDTPFKLCCTATPSPNDHVELGNHAEFLDVMSSGDMLTRFFINDGAKAQNLRLKKHSVKDFWKWVTSWAVCLSHPRDLGDEYDMPDFDLPELKLIEHLVPVDQATLQRAWDDGRLLPDTHVSSTSHHKVKRDSLTSRIEKVKEVVNAIDETEPINIWCDTNYESDALQVAFPDGLEVRGSDKRQIKQKKLEQYSSGESRMIITKPKIAGLGLNWQHCTEPVFFGVSFSFEMLHQALRRNYRFGVKKPINAHLIISESEGNVLTTIRQKQKQFVDMQTEMREAVKQYGLFREDKRLQLETPDTRIEKGKNWDMRLGDNVELIKDLPDNSVDLCFHSPPFSTLYTYSASEADMGNSASDEEFFKHYKFLIRELYRTTKAGRLCVVHCKELSRYATKTGATGIYDFVGDVIRAFEEFDKPDINDYGKDNPDENKRTIEDYKRDISNWEKEAPKWQYHSRVMIWKDPVEERAKTNADGLLHKSFKSNSAKCRTGIPDYLVVFRKWDTDADMNEFNIIQNRTEGDYVGNQPPPRDSYIYRKNHKDDAYSIAVWQRYASPCWFDINFMDVLNTKLSRDPNDEKHIAPLPLDVARRVIDLWSNKGDIVFSPFAGVGSELVPAIQMGRKALGFELKESYYRSSIKHLKEAELEMSQLTLFDLLAQTRENAS